MENEFGFVEDAVDDLGFVEDPITAAGQKYQPVAAADKEWGDQLAAGVSGFADTVTMGLGDETAAGMSAAGDWILDKTGINDLGDQSFTDMYRNRLGQGQDVRERLAGQYPTEFEQGEWTGMGTQMLAPSGVTKAGLAGAGRVKAGADTMIGKGAGKVKDVILDSPLKNYPKASAFVKGAVPRSVGDLATMGAGAVVSPVNPITGAAGALGAKRGLEAGARHFVGRAKFAKEQAGQVKEHATSLRDLLGRLEEIAPKESMTTTLRKNLPTIEKIAEKTTGYVKSDYTGRAAGAVYDFGQKYGPYMKELAVRGNDAMIANVFIKQNQDPEFRAMLKAAKLEAAKESEEN